MKVIIDIVLYVLTISYNVSSVNLLYKICDLNLKVILLIEFSVSSANAPLNIYFMIGSISSSLLNIFLA